MIASATLSFWGPLLIRLGLELGVLAGIAALAASRIRTAASRRWIWQATLLAMLLSTAGELLGVRGGLRAVRAALPKAAVEPRRLAVLPLATDQAPPLPLPEAPGGGAAKPAPSAPSLWPAAIWAALSSALLLRLALAHARGCLRHRRRQPLPAELEPHIRQLAARLGLRRVEATIWPGLRGPIAFGVRRPSIALPANALRHLPAPARDAVLLHELAHLAARDPLWLAVADVVTALLGWHPAVYWIARRLRAEMEAAADDASGLVPEGRLALAEAIVQYGRELAAPEWARGLGVVTAKLRSPLARRVQALLGPPTPWIPHSRIARITLPTALAASAFLLLPAWPGSLQPSLLELSLSRSQARDLLAPDREQARPPEPMPVAAALSGETSHTRTTPESTPVAKPASHTPAASLPPEAGKHLATGYRFLEAGLVDLALSCFERARHIDPNATAVREAFERANALRSRLANDHPSRTGPPALRETWARLEQIVLPRVHFVDAPLSEVVPWLRRESVRRDPAGEGVWLELVARLPEPSENGPETDPLPVTVDDVRIRMAQPLENVTLRTALDALIQSASAPIVYEPLPHDLSFFRVLVTAAIPPTRRLVTRVWRVDADDLLAKLFPTLPTHSPELAKRTPKELPEIFRAAGISVDPPHALFLSEGKGLLMFRGTATDVTKLEDFLDRLQLKPVKDDRTSTNAFAAGAEVPSLGPTADTRTTVPIPPPPAGPTRLTGPSTPAPVPVALQLEGRLAEIPEAAARELGLDWLLATPDAARQPHFRGAPTGDLPGAAVAHATNLNVEVHRLEPAAVALSSTQYGALLGRLDRVAGVQQSVFPQVIAPSGGTTRMSVLDARTIVTAGSGGPEGIRYHSEPMDFGPSLHLLPRRHADGWSLSVTGRVSEFLGYEDPGKERLEARLANGQIVQGQVPKPLIRVRESHATVHATAGQTLVLRLPDDERTRRILGNWFRRDRRVTETFRSYVFISLTDAPAPPAEFSPPRHRDSRVEGRARDERSEGQ